MSLITNQITSIQYSNRTFFTDGMSSNPQNWLASCTNCLAEDE